MSYAIVTVVVMILDQLLKYWTTTNVPLDALGDECVKLIPGVMHLTNVHNNGAAFSILQDARWLLVFVTVAFAVLVIVLINQEIIRGSFGKWTAVLVMAGALSNGLDRAVYGYVVDMFELEFIKFAVFNIADIFITVFGILFCVYILLQKPDPQEAAAAKRRSQSGRSGKSGRYSGRHQQGSAAAYRKNAESVETAEEPEAEYDPAEETEDDTVRMSRSERRRMRSEALESIPKRGEHKNLQDELAPNDPSNPFAEWGVDSNTLFSAEDIPAFDVPAELAAEKAEAQADTGAEQTSAEEEKQSTLSFGSELSFDLDELLSEFEKHD